MKDALDEVLLDIQTWQNMIFQAVMITIRSPTAIKAFSSSHPGNVLSLPKLFHNLALVDALKPADILESFSLGSNDLSKHSRPIHFSDCRISELNVGSARVVVESFKSVSGNVVDRIPMQALDLTRKISEASPDESGILECRGIALSESSSHEPRKSHASLVFKLPERSHRIKSLRDVLQNPVGHPLDQRIAIARQLAKSIVFIHASNFVHKNIRPETILMASESSSLVGQPYLVGFEEVRGQDADTLYHGDDHWFKNIYRHPSRQGTVLQHRYRMQHDVYSVGVCLLEIGLWHSFVRWIEFGVQAETGPGLMLAEQIKESSIRFLVTQLLQTMATTSPVETRKADKRNAIPRIQNQAAAFKDMPR